MKVLWTILLFTLSLSAAAQQFEVRVDSNQMLIGDLRRAVLRVQNIGLDQLDTVDASTWLEKKVEPLRWSPWQQNGEAISRHFQFMAFDTGYIILPPLVLHYTDAGEDLQAFSNDIALEVYGVTIDSTGLAPLREIRKEKLSLRDIWPYLAAAALALAILAWFHYRPKRNKVEEVIIEVPIPPDEVALQRLAELDAKKLWQAGRIKEYQTELTHTIRWYLEEKFSIPALESTTTEILRDLSDQPLENEQRNILSQILNMADLVKFAKATPAATIHQEFMQKAENLVRSTRHLSSPSQEEE